LGPDSLNQKKNKLLTLDQELKDLEQALDKNREKSKLSQEEVTKMKKQI